MKQNEAQETLIRDQAAALNLATRAWQTAHTSEAHNPVANSFSQVEAILQGHTGELNSAEFSPDGQRIVTASEETARIFRVSLFQTSPICWRSSSYLAP